MTSSSTNCIVELTPDDYCSYSEESDDRRREA